MDALERTLCTRSCNAVQQSQYGRGKRLGKRQHIFFKTLLAEGRWTGFRRTSEARASTVAVHRIDPNKTLSMRWPVFTLGWVMLYVGDE